MRALTRLPPALMRILRRHASAQAAALVLATALLLAALGAFGAGAQAQSLTFPALEGRVVEEAAILSPAARSALDAKLAAFEEKTTDQLVVVTLKSLQGTAIEDYGYQLGRHWQIGQKDKNNGVLLIVAPNERKVRIEVGYGLEGDLTDAVSRLIIDNAILPRFRANDYPGGIARGTDDIIAVLSGDAQEFQQRAAKRPDNAPPGVDLGTLLLLILIAFIVLRMIARAGGGGPWSGAGPIFIPMGSRGSGSSWGSGSGGGFSGGGGSFGGGGSSGSW